MKHECPPAFCCAQPIFDSGIRLALHGRIVKAAADGDAPQITGEDRCNDTWYRYLMLSTSDACPPTRVWSARIGLPPDEKASMKRRSSIYASINEA